LVILLLAGAARAEAQACCAGSGAFLPARLKLHELALVGLQLRATDGLGSLDGHGGYVGAPPGATELDLEQDLVAGLRVFERGQLGLTVPLVETRRTAAELAELGGGPGDVSLSFRYDFLYAAESAHLPGLALQASVTAPTGRAPEASTSPLLTDATGTGAWQGAIGGSVEQVFGPVVLSLNGSVAFSATRHVGEIAERLGPQLTGLGAAGYVFANEAAVALALSTTQSLDATLNGASLEHSGRGLTTLSATAGLPLTDAWRLQGALNFDLPVLGRNRTTGAGGTLTLLWAWT
jgi:hypothetical protein